MNQRLQFGDYELDLARRELSRSGTVIELQPKVFAVLALLVRNPERSLSRDDFLEQVWSGRFVTENVLSRCIRQLRKVLGDDAASPSYIRTVRGHGYRFLAPVAPATDPGVQAMTRMAVLPFQPLVPENRQPSLELGLAATMVTDLSRIEGIVVRSLSAVMDAAAERGLEHPLELGQVLDVDVVIEGRLQASDNRVRLNVRALRVADGTALMAERFDESLTDLFELQDRLSQAVMAALAIRFGGDDRARKKLRGTRSVEAYRAYVDGSLALAGHSAEAAETALAHFEAALELDQDYLEPLIGIAEANDLLATLGNDTARYHENTRRAAEKVISIDPSRARAYTCLGKVAWQYDWDWPRAESLLRKAAELDPNDAEALIALSDFLCYQRRFDEALDVAERAGELNPFSPWIQSLVAQALHMGGHSDEALSQARRAVELAPGFGFARFFLGLSLCQLERYAEGIDQIEQAIEVSGRQDFLGALAYARGRSGDVAGAQRILAKLEQARSEGAPVPPAAIAIIYAGLGDTDRALSHMREVLRERSWHILLLHADSSFAEVRARPEGLALLREAGLPV
ncbi:MAG: tetratricopeptide repeat protein [Xanthomonadales bacterium]|nr:tetratricopeptide repeat protein [Xanthomonadales bacterium]